jgi:hypothetical protein
MIFSLQSMMMVPLPIMSPYPPLLVRPHLPPLPLLWVLVWATSVGGSAHAWQADARSISNCRQERDAPAHGWEIMSADVKGIED